LDGLLSVLGRLCQIEQVASAVVAPQILLGTLDSPHIIPIARIKDFLQLQVGGILGLGDQLGYLTLTLCSTLQLLTTVLQFLHCSDSMLVPLQHRLGDPQVHRTCCISLLSRNAYVHPFGSIEIGLIRHVPRTSTRHAKGYLSLKDVVDEGSMFFRSNPDG
jgi:hypothetical protein